MTAFDPGPPTGLRFRNIDADPSDPVETWPFEGILTAIERGSLPDWRRLAAAISADPWGPLASQVVEAMRILGPSSDVAVFVLIIDEARTPHPSAHEHAGPPSTGPT